MSATLHTLLYMFIGLAYIAYPLYLVTKRPTNAEKRFLGLGLLVYGILILFWPDQHEPLLILLGAGMLTGGFAVYLGGPSAMLPWLLAMTYSTAVLRWPEALDPFWKLAAALVLVIGFDRCMNAARRPVAPRGPHE